MPSCPPSGPGFAREKLPYVAQSVQFDHTVAGRALLHRGLLRDHEAAELPRRTTSARCTGSPSGSSLSGTRALPSPTRPWSSTGVGADFDSLPSAFGPASARRTADGQLQIAVLAHDTSTLPPGRAPITTAPTPHTWSPYRPEYPQPVADYAQELAKKCLDCKPLVGAFEDDVDQVGQQRAPGTAEPVPGGSLGEHVGQAPGATQSAGPGRRALGQRARPVEQPGTRERTRHETTFARVCSSIWGASWPACRAVARWPPTGSPPCRILASSCPR